MTKRLLLGGNPARRVAFLDQDELLLVRSPLFGPYFPNRCWSRYRRTAVGPANFRTGQYIDDVERHMRYT